MKITQNIFVLFVSNLLICLLHVENAKIVKFVNSAMKHGKKQNQIADNNTTAQSVDQRNYLLNWIC